LRTAFPEVVLQLGLVGLAVGVTMLTFWLFRSGRVAGAAAATPNHVVVSL
jgi:hypothetical protein